MIWSKMKPNYSDKNVQISRFQEGKFQFKKKKVPNIIMKLYFLNRFLLIFILKRFCYRIMNNLISRYILILAPKFIQYSLLVYWE